MSCRRYVSNLYAFYLYFLLAQLPLTSATTSTLTDRATIDDQLELLPIGVRLRRRRYMIYTTGRDR